jgi:arylsulfatase A-like enzyme
MRPTRPLVVILSLCLAIGCAAPPKPGPATLRLTDLYKPESVANRMAPSPPPPRTEWRFDGPPPAAAPGEKPNRPATRGWEAFNGVTGLAIRDGRLVGRTTDDMPLVHFERTSGWDDPDPVQEIEVRLRLSAGSQVGMAFSSSEKLDRTAFLGAARVFPPAFTSPAVAGNEMRTYVLKTNLSGAGSRVRHVLLRPGEQPGATFEVESIRLILRKEHLAAVASGLGWQGLSEIYRETLVARSPEAIKFDLQLPSRPRLEVALGTVEDGPVTFRVLVHPDGGEEATALERTVTRPHRWETVPVDLAPYAGKQVALTLSLAAEKHGTIGFWGNPAVRSAGATPSPSDTPTGAAPPQGVIVVWADTLRRDHLGAYGYKRPTSPVIDRLAREGVMFRDCVGQASWTKVATPTLLTSLYPSSHGVLDAFDRLPGSAVTLAEVYRDAGYATLSLSSILFTGKLTNLHQGFEELHEDASLPERRSSKTAREYVDRLLPWLAAHRDVPFFVFLHVADPHDPYKPHPPYDTLWADAAAAPEHERQLGEARKVISDPLLRAFGMPSREELVKAKIDPDAYAEFDRAWYDGSIRGMDAEIGRLVERLRELRLDRRTLLLFTGDHGEEFYEHGRAFHGQSVYGELNNMPLVLWGPGVVPAGRAVEDTVQTVDLLPTLLELSRLPIPPGVQGHSLVPLLLAGDSSARGAAHASAPSSRPAISEKAETKELGGPPPRDTAAEAVVLGGWKLIHNTKRPEGKPEFELYDHAKDPLDAHDVAAAHPEEVARLAQVLQSWRKMAEAGRLKPDTDAAKSLSKEELERLKSLGYIQ